MWNGKTGFDWGGGGAVLRADCEKAERGGNIIKRQIQPDISVEDALQHNWPEEKAADDVMHF